MEFKDRSTWALDVSSGDRHFMVTTHQRAPNAQKWILAIAALDDARSSRKEKERL